MQSKFSNIGTQAAILFKKTTQIPDAAKIEK